MSHEKNGPNILVLLSDQHHARRMGCAGDAVVRTPNMDALAARGTRFDAACCQSPLCVPSRMSFLTTMMPSANRVWTNGCRLNTGIGTFAHAVGAAGYETALIGRMHLANPATTYGFEHHLVGHLTSPAVGGQVPAIRKELRGCYGQMKDSVLVAGPGRQPYQAYDEDVAAATARFLETRADADRPFLAVAGFVLPHCPFICPKEQWDYYDGRVGPPDMPEGHLADLPPAMRRAFDERGYADLTDEQIRRARTAYYGLVTYLDLQIGRILDALDLCGLAENTVVVYTSDHGEQAGEHGLWCKGTFYDGSSGVPMLWSWPGRFAEGRTVAEAVGLIDIGPTLIELAGGEPLPASQGRSLRALLDGERDETDGEALAEHYTAKGAPSGRMVRRGRWKLIHHDGYDPLLFDLEADPGEFTNLADDPRHADRVADLHHRALDGWDPDFVHSEIQRAARLRQPAGRWHQTALPMAPDQWIPPEGSFEFPLS